MSDAEKKKILMYEEIITFLRENKVITVGLPGINSNVNKLYRILDEIENKEKIVSSETLKRTLKVNELKDNLILYLLPLISALFRFARENNDILLKERTKLSRSNLVLYKNYELINKALLMAVLGEKNIRQLNRYGIKNGHIEALRKRIDEFHRLSTDNGSGPDTAVFALDKLFLQADSIIANIDDIFDNYVDDEIFYEEYQWVREHDYEQDEDEKEDLLYEMEEN